MSLKNNLDKAKQWLKTLIILELKQSLVDLFQGIWIQKWSLKIIKYLKKIIWVIGMTQLGHKKKTNKVSLIPKQKNKMISHLNGDK